MAKGGNRGVHYCCLRSQRLGEPLSNNTVGTLDAYKNAFNRVGWFIPPYVTMEFLGKLVKRIRDSNCALTQQELGEVLAQIYSPENLAAMVAERYPIVPYVQDDKKIIAEVVAAHFMRLDHVAVAGLLPCIEGIGRKLADSRAVAVTSITSVFVNLANDCKSEVLTHNIGAVGEIVSMMDSFIEFTAKHLYVMSERYPLTDNTNRHGILHGAFADGDYGEPINFYKAIACIDFLCFISGLRTPIGLFAPDHTAASQELSAYYVGCLLSSRYRAHTP
jgi:hypothetical protein